MEQHPSTMPPAMFWDGGRRRIVPQIWDWQDERRYAVHLYITRQAPNDEWITSHFLGHYRAITPEELAAHMEQVGFRQVQILQPMETAYYQPVVVAIRV
jgi:glycine/sarcosine N-methyltransferase